MNAEGLRSSVVLLVVGTLCLLAVALYGCAALLVGFGKTVPGELWQAAGLATGAVGGLLANTRHDAPADVNVVNPPQDPAQVAISDPDSVGPRD